MRILAASVLLVVAACAHAPAARDSIPLQKYAEPVPDPPRDPARGARLATAFDALDAYFSAFHTKTRSPGMSVGLVADGALVWSKGYGVDDLLTQKPADVDSVYRIGSITKAFTATVAVKLRDEGKLELDAPAVTYLPELRDVVYPTTDSPPITMRQLLTHTSGLPDVGDPGTEGIGDETHTPTEATLLASLRGLRLVHVPGEEWSYSSIGYALAGLAIARITGSSFRDATTGSLIRPLGMTATVWDPELVPRERLTTAYEPGEGGTVKPVAPWRFGAMEPAGGLYSTVRDMARFLALQLDAWPSRSSRDAGPLSRASLREMQQPQRTTKIITLPDKNPKAWTEGFGIGWQSGYVCGVGLFLAWSGGTEGHTGLIFAFPAQGVGIVILANVRDVSWRGVWLDVWRILDTAGGLGSRLPAGERDAVCPE